MFAMNFANTYFSDRNIEYTCCLNTCNSNETCVDWIPRGMPCNDPAESLPSYKQDWSAWIKHGTTFQILPYVYRIFHKQFLTLKFKRYSIFVHKI